MAPQDTIADVVALTVPLQNVEGGWAQRNKDAFEALFGPNGRYLSSGAKRVALRAPDQTGDDALFASYLHPDNPTSGAYGGMSFVLFPRPDAPALIALVIGTNGLAPDEEILGRPGHARRAAAIARWLNRRHGGGQLVAWAKDDIVRIDQGVPRDVTDRWPQYEAVFSRYGRVLYAVFAPTGDDLATRDATAAFLDLAMWERGIMPRSSAATHVTAIRSEWQQHLFPNLSQGDVEGLLSSRRYVIVEGPPGTGKTRMALELLSSTYGGHGMSVQFHPNTTYEDVIGGLAPVDTQAALGLQFRPVPGLLMRAANAAAASPDRPYLLHIDEINRADLSKVLGEAIYLLETDADHQRTIELSHDYGPPFGRTLTLPPNLHIIGTMNTADRSLAILDVAVRRRFAFARLWPQASIVATGGCTLMQDMFASLLDIFTDYASESAFDLVPGHSYFLEQDDALARTKLKVSVGPLLREYLNQGYVSGFGEAVRAYLQRIDAL